MSNDDYTRPSISGGPFTPAQAHHMSQPPFDHIHNGERCRIIQRPEQGNIRIQTEFGSTAWVPAAELLELDPRQYDRHRCECRTASGGRCRYQTRVIVRKRTGDRVAEFGACLLHERCFTVREVHHA